MVYIKLISRILPSRFIWNWTWNRRISSATYATILAKICIFTGSIYTTISCANIAVITIIIIWAIWFFYFTIFITTILIIRISIITLFISFYFPITTYWFFCFAITITSISFALASYEHSINTFVEILNTVSQSDDINSFIYGLSGRLIYDPVLSDMAQSIIASDANALNAALQMEGTNPKTIGEALSKTSQNVTIVQRLDAMLNSMDSQSAKSSMIVLASLFHCTIWGCIIKRSAS